MIKNRLISEGYKKNQCEECGQRSKWKKKNLEMELDHIDGDRTNHLLPNLKMLCPNCHSQTKTFCGKNKNGVVMELVDMTDLVLQTKQIKSVVQ